MFSLNIKGELYTADRVQVMGILNVTDDSFYDGGKYKMLETAVEHGLGMVRAGAHIIDVGGYSSRPGAADISTDEELDRVLPVIERLSKESDILLSIDTFRSVVAREAVKAGAHMVNDISAGEDDPQMISTVALLGIPYIIMHKKGKPATMQQNPEYMNVSLEVLDYLRAKKEECYRAGIVDLIIDPGFGFGKTIEHNFQLLADLQMLEMLDLPILVGLSRKSTIYRTIGKTPEDSLIGTQFLHAFALERGAQILRVHDIEATIDCVKLWSKFHSYL